MIDQVRMCEIIVPGLGRMFDNSRRDKGNKSQ